MIIIHHKVNYKMRLLKIFESPLGKSLDINQGNNYIASKK